MPDREKLYGQLERLAIVLNEIMPDCSTIVRDAIKLMKEQTDEIKELRSMVEFWKEKSLHT